MTGIEATTPRAVRDTDRAREIQQVAAELFFTHGYDATTTRQIAQVLRMTSASIYYHYADKEQILFELICSTMEQLADGARTVLQHESIPENQLAGVVAHHVVLHGVRPKEATLGETELRSLTGNRRVEVLRMRDEYAALLVAVLEAGARAGRFDVPQVKLSAYGIIAQCTNVGIWYHPEGPLDLDQIATVYAMLALRMVGAPRIDETAIAHLAKAATDFHREWQ